MTVCVNESIKKTELNNEAKKLRGIWSHPSHVPKLFEYLTKGPSPLRTSSTGWGDRQSSWRGTFCIRTRKVNFISLYQNNNQSLMWRATPGSVNEAEKRGALPEVLHCGQVRQLWIQFIKWIISILSGSTCLSSRLKVSGCWSHRVCDRHWLPTSILQSHYAKKVRDNDC